MKTLVVQAEIGPNGRLRVEVPCDLPPGQAEVVLVVQPVAQPAEGVATAKRHKARSGLFVGRAAQIDLDAALDEMNLAWQTKLQDAKT